MPFVEVADEVYLLRYPVLDVNSTLVIGSEVAAVVDTLATDAQAGELLTAVRAVTSLPLVVINTHHHFDHCFGNRCVVAASPGAAVWAPRGGRVRTALPRHPVAAGVVRGVAAHGTGIGGRPRGRGRPAARPHRPH